MGEKLLNIIIGALAFLVVAGIALYFYDAYWTTGIS